MATPAPTGTDVTELKFMLQNKVPIYKGDGNVKDGCNLLAAASVHGLIFAGTTGPQLKVLKLKDITPDKTVDEIVPLRTVPLPSEPFQMAISSDHGFLAVDVVVGGVPIIQVYSVPSFLTPAVVKLTEIRTSAEGGVRSTQILWNPVIHNMFSVRTENGALSVYTLKEPSGIEFHSLDKSEGAICACWSPKGKQLVVGFANGKLMQFKPDLKPARTIVCPPGVMDGSFDVIAVQWLSTYQFAAVYLPHAEDSVPSLFIVNAPKVGNPTFINYDDICYSQSGPRKGQVFLVHILQWNLLLMASANSMEVGILGTTETGEAPSWLQWTTTDEARAELPLSSDKQETLPTGLALETGCTHQITISEQTYPVMPMIHLLSTYGMLVSFNVLNLMPNVPNICCPPRPTVDTSGKFEKVDVNKQQSAPAAPADMTFTVPAGATSTPAVPKTKTFFSPNESKASANLFGVPTSAAAASPAVAPTFGKPLTFGSMPPLTATTEQPKTTPFGSGGPLPSFGGPSKPFAPPTQQQPAAQSSSLLKTAIAQPSVQPQQQQKAPPEASSKPLVTIPPTYTPPPAPADVSRSSSGDNLAKQPPKQAQKKQESTDDTNSVIRTMITEEIRKFERELADLQKRCTNLNITIGSKEESTAIIKSLKELQDLSVQAAESTESLTSDVQALRLGLNEAFAMVAEADSKNSIYKHPSPNQFQETHAMSQSSRRQLASLQNMFALNENQLQIVNKQIDAQWSDIQEASRVNSKRRMHVPSLEVLYQTLSKQQEILNRQREKLSYIKAKLGMRESIRGLEKGRKNNLAVDNVDSLTDSIISLTIADQVREEARRLSEAKMSSLRDMLKNRKVVTVKPSRPDRVGLNSEVVLERRNAVRRLNQEKEKVKSEAAAKPSVSLLPTAVQPARKVEEKPKAQPKFAPQPTAPAKPVAVESAKPFELPKATGLPNFGSKPAAAAVATVAQQPSTTAASFGFGSAPAATNKPAAPVIFGAGGTSSSATSVFNFKQPAKPFAPTSVPQEVPITKETTLFGSTTIKPVQATSTVSSKDKENQEPAPKPAIFGFGSTTIQAIPKADSSTNGNSESKNAVLTFSAAANSKPAFAFGSATGGGSTAFGAPALNLTKEKEPEVKKDEKPKQEPKKDEPLPPGFGSTGAADEGAKTAFPALTNLLQKVDTTAAETPKTQSPFGSSAKATTASNIFGTSTATIAPGTGIFGTVKPAVAPTTSSSSSNGGGVDSATASKADSTAAVATEASSSTAAVTTPTASTVFGSVKPTTTTTSSSEFAFGGSGGFSFATATKATDLSVKSDSAAVDAKPIFGTVTSSAAPVPSTVTTSSTVPAVSSSTAVTTTTTATTSSSFSFGSVVTPLPTPTSAAPAVTSASSPTSTTDATSNLFGSFNICSPSAVVASTAPSGNIFGSSTFSTPKSETTSIFGSSSAFGAVTTDASKPTSIFGATAAATSSPGTNLFGTVTSSAAGGSIFGTASSTSSPFSATTGSTSTGNLFGSVASPTASTGSIFGGTSVATTQQPTGLFGAAAPASAPATTAASIFGGTTGTSGGGLFGSVASSPSAAGGSIFGGTSAFGSAAGANTSTGNIFGAATTGAATTGFGSSAFGQPSSPQQSGQSIFGGAASSTPGFGSSSFGSPAPSGGAFSSPTAGSVAQSGFGSLSSSAFNKPAFGGTPAFGATPAFGGAPAFGATPVFGSSPSFGSTAFSHGFGQAPLSPSSQSNNLFEQLGSSSTGVSFGNLAQQQADKPPQFGGSSFSSWR